MQRSGGGGGGGGGRGGETRRPRLVLHVYTETQGGTHADLRASRPANFAFPPAGGSTAGTAGTARRGAGPAPAPAAGNREEAEAPLYHTLGELEPPPPADCAVDIHPAGGSKEEAGVGAGSETAMGVETAVHWVMNNSPRDTVLCMARADVLIPRCVLGQS